MAFNIGKLLKYIIYLLAIPVLILLAVASLFSSLLNLK